MSRHTTEEITFVQGALFIVDNAGQCPSGITSRDFQNMAIENHLRNHTYSSIRGGCPKTEEFRERVDLQKMRKKIEGLASKKGAKTTYQPEPGETRVDAIFRLGSAEMPSQVLEEYEYYRGFPEANLPTYAAERTPEINAPYEAPTPDKTSSPAESRKRKRKSDGTRNSVDTSKEPLSNVARMKEAKLQGLGKSANDSAQDDVSIFTVRNAKEQTTPETLRQPRKDHKLHETVLGEHEHFVATQPSIPESIGSEPLDATQKSMSDSQQYGLQKGVVDIKATQRQLTSLQSDVREAVTTLHNCIGEIENFPTPLVSYSSDDLAQLFVRSWGVEWRAASDQAIEYNDFKPEFVTMTLISGFLHDKILSHQVPAQTITQHITKLLQANGPLGEEYLSRMNLAQMELATLQSAHDSAVETARTTLAHDDATVQVQLQEQAQQLSQTLWYTLVPHLEKLTLLGQLYNKSSGRLQKDLLKDLRNVFASAVTPLVRDTL